MRRGKTMSAFVVERGSMSGFARWVVLSFLLVSVAALAAACGNSGDESAGGSGSATGAGDAVLLEDAADGASTGSAGDAVVAGGEGSPQSLPRLLDLGADKCVPCKAMAPIIEEMSGTFAGRLNVEFIDVWKNRDAASQYSIQVIPTQIFFDADGGELFRHQGFFSREDMLAKWRELGYEFEG